MRLGKVIGRVTLSKNVSGLDGARWLIVSPYNRDFSPTAAHSNDRTLGSDPSAVIYDNLGGGTGDTVGYIEGREAAAPFGDNVPIDAICGLLVDTIDYRPLP